MNKSVADDLDDCIETLRELLAETLDALQAAEELGAAARSDIAAGLAVEELRNIPANGTSHIERARRYALLKRFRAYLDRSTTKETTP